MTGHREGTDGVAVHLPRHSGLIADDTGRWPTRVAMCALVAVLLVSPWAFGAVQPQVQVWAFVAVVFALVCWLAQSLTAHPAPATLPVAIVPLMAAIGLGLFQLIPLSPGVLSCVSPKSAELRTQLIGEPLAAAGPLADPIAGSAATDAANPISLYPASTRRDLALLALAAATFVLGALFFRSPVAALVLCGVLAVNGAALSFFGLVQKLTFNGLLYWQVPLTNGGGPFGPFVNRNNAGGYLNLCLAGAVALALWAFHSHQSDRRAPATSWGQYFGDVWAGIVRFVGELSGLKILVLALAGLILTGVLASFSRGAMVALVAGLVVTVLITRRWAERRTVRVLISLTLLAGVALIGWVGMRESLLARYATLVDERIVENRIPHWQDGLQAVPDFWLTGSGLGTYRYVYRPYQERFNQAWFFHAENQYLESIVEGGVAGLGLVLVMIAVVGWAAWRIIQDDRDRRAVAVAVAGIFALVTQVVHSFFDFGLYIPANMLLLAAICGALTGRAARLAGSQLSARYLALPRRMSLATLVIAGLLVACSAGWYETHRVAAAENALKSTRFAGPSYEISDEALASALCRVTTATRKLPDNADVQLRLAELSIHRYRIAALDELKQRPNATAVAELWHRTSPLELHGRAHYLARNNRTVDLDALRQAVSTQGYLRDALRHLLLARRACPLFADVHLAVGELCFLVADPQSDQIHLQRSRQLARANPHVRFRKGLLELQAGRFELAWTDWKDCLALTPQYTDTILQLAAQRLEPAQLVEHVLPDSPEVLLNVARRHFAAPEQAAVRHAIAQRMQATVQTETLPEADRSYYRGTALAMQGNEERACTELSRAVELRVDRTDWRYELALMLQHQRRMTDAHGQAVLCARMEPENGNYRQLLKEINRTILLGGQPE